MNILQCNGTYIRSIYVDNTLYFLVNDIKQKVNNKKHNIIKYNGEYYIPFNKVIEITNDKIILQMIDNILKKFIPNNIQYFPIDKEYIGTPMNCNNTCYEATTFTMQGTPTVQDSLTIQGTSNVECTTSTSKSNLVDNKCRKKNSSTIADRQVATALATAGVLKRENNRLKKRIAELDNSSIAYF